MIVARATRRASRRALERCARGLKERAHRGLAGDVEHAALCAVICLPED